jgi:hypothetical protein
MALRAATATTAGIAYWGVMFGVGFFLGTARVLAVAPRLGEGLAVGLELPVMLAVCWFAARWLVRRWRLIVPEAALAGAVGFVLLMLAEAATAAVFFDQGYGQWLAGLVRFPASLGLAAQVLAALLPPLIARR